MENIDIIPTKEQLDAIDALDLKTKFMDIVPGMAIEFDPEEADQMGAFEEDAMSLEDAIEASIDPREAQ
jgi:type IV secretion system protein VirB1